MKQKLLIYLFVLFFSVAGFAQTGPGGVTDGLRIWLRPEVGITTSGGNVTNWGDQSGIAIPNDFDQKNASVQPTIAAAEAKFNFHPAVNFNGSNFMRSKVATEAPFDANITDGALYVVDNRTTSGKRLVFGLGDAPIGVDPGANANKPAIGEDSRLGSLFQEDNMSYIGNSYYNYKIGESFIHGVSWWTDKYAKKWCKLDQSGYWELQARDENEAIHSAKGAVLGSQQDQPYDGYIQEVIAYQKRLSDEEMLRIDSYLMIKYGIVTSKDLKYINFIVDSGSNKIWSSALANSNIGSSRYVFSQAGIGRDDLSALNQKQSRSVNEKENLGFNITMGLTTIAPTNAGNLAAFEADRSFMFWADNNRGGGFNIWMPADSGPANKRHEKTWQIQETGTVGTVKFAIPYSERPYKRFFLVRSTDEIFDKSDEYIPLKKFTSGTTTYWACDVDFNDKDYFTLAVDTNPESIALRFTPTVATIAEGRSQIVTVGFPSDITLDTDTVAKFSITGTAINGTDYTTIANTVTIPAGQNSVAINIQALSDSVLELDETVILKGTSVTSASGATWTSSAANATTITITDSSLPSDKILRFSPAKVVVSEGNTTMLKVSLPEGITTTEKIGFSFTLSGTATVNRDYDGLIRTGRGEIPAGKNFIEIGLRALTDSVIELDETAIVTGGGDITSRLTGFSWDYAANEATVVITDASNPANKVLDFSTNAVSVKEGFSSNIYVRVPNLSTGVTTMGYPLVVNYTLSGTATNGIDYTTLSGSVTIEEGASSAEIKVATLTDNLIEPDETVIITGDPLTGFTWGSNNVATVTIKDATDVVNRILRFSPITANVTEGDSTTIQLSLPEGFTVASSVDINYSIAGSATNDADYTALTGIATIPAGSGTTEITIAAKNDNLLEADETILIKGVTTAGFLWSNLENSATVTIKDANPASDKVLRFSSTTEKIAEGSSTRLKVSLPEGITTTSDIRFYYAVGGTATSGKDYTRLTGTGTILAGNNSVDIVVAALTDAVIEGDETVIVTGGGIVGDSLTGFTWDATAKEAIVTITDVTDPAKKVLNFSPTKADVTEGLSTSIKVSLPTGVTLEESLTVNYTIAGTATSDTDYKKLTGSVTIEAGSGFAMIEVASLSDAIIESDETVIITGYDTAGFTWGSANVATVTIIDVTNPVNKVLSISPLTASVAEGEKTTLTVSLPEGITVGTPVDIKYDVYGLAINGTDYALLTGTATIPAGSGTAKIEVTALRDAIIEYDETVFIVGAATAGFIWSPTANTATVTIKDSTAKVLRFSPTTENVAEGSSTTITVSLPEGITAVEHIYFDYTIGGTARGGNVLGGDDYMSLMNINEYISAGNNSVDIVVETLTDLVIELDETVILTGGDITTDSDITGFTWDNAAKEATVTITDVTDPVDKVLYFSPTTAAVAEGRSTDIKVSLPEGVTLGYPLTVNYTISGTATSDTDYTALTGSVTIPVRSRSATIRVAALPDNLIEPDETVIITGGTVPGFTWGSDNEVTITIKDDIAKKVLSMTPYLANVAEGESTTIEINLPERVIVTSPVDIKYQVSGSAINGTDYALLTGTATIPAGSGTAKIEVTALRDAIIEYDEYIYIQGAPTAGFTWNRAANSATATIIDTNPSSDKVLRFSQTTKKIAEGSSTTLTVSLPEGITAQSVIYFDYTLGGTATSSGGSSGNDYRWLNGSGMILNGDNSVDIVVEALTDFVIELDETVIVTGGDIRTYTDMTGFTWDPTANSATVTITDVTDVANTVLNFSPTTANVAEGGNTGISLDLPTGVTLGYPLTVNYTVSGTATSGSDYTALTGSVTIPAGSGTTEIMIAAKNDNLIEPDETVVITGAITAGFTWGSDNVATITIKDATGNDPAKKVLSFSPITTNVAEGESTILMVSLPEGIAVASPTDIKYEIAVSSTAINGADYDTLTGTATIPAGSGTAEITIATKNDNLLEANETIIITGVATAGFTWNRAANSATVTITDSNPASDKKLSFSQTTEKIAEGSSTTLKVSLPQGITATSGITFNYAVGGTATSGDDYTALTGTGTIAAGNNFAAIVIDAKTDTVIEGEETVILTGGAITTGSLTGFAWDDAAKEATVTITDVTDVANTVLNFSPITANVAEGSSISIKVSLPEGVTLGNPLIVNYRVSGTATSDTDYSALTGSVTIPAGDSYAMIEIAAKNDNLIEPDETVVITGGTVSGFTWGSDNVATVTIKDVIDPVNRVLSFSSDRASVAEGESTTLTVSLPQGIAVTSPLDIYYEIAVSSTAINGADYETLSGVATIPAGSGMAIIEVEALLDNLIEANETIIITGAASAGFTWSATANTATVTITDSNPLSDKVLRFSPTTENVAEGSSTTLEVLLPEGVTATSDITFNYAVDGTATSVDDYTRLTGIGTIPAGQNSAAIVVTALTDAIIERDETVILAGGAITAGSLTGFSWDGAAKKATVTITDVTDPLKKVLRFSPATAAVAEGSSTSINVSLPAGVTLGYPLTVNYTVSGTATKGTDYSALSGSVTIPAGSEGTITVAALSDTIIESDETVIITGSATAGFTWGSDNVATITIKDVTHPANKVLSISPATGNLKEGESTTLTVSLPRGVSTGTDFVVNYSLSGTATNGTDYTALSGKVTIAAGQISAVINIEALKDGVIEPNETVLITGAATAGFTWDAAAKEALVTIIDLNREEANNRIVSLSTETIYLEDPLVILTASLPSGVTLSEAIYVNLDNTFSSFSDLSMDNFVIIPAGQNSAEFEVRAGNKRKNNERVEITGSVNNLIFDTATYSFTLESGAVIVKNDLLEIANVVSANGDGINDYFTIRNIEKYKDNTVTILDRRGVEVFSARGYDNQSIYFDGQYKGKDLDDGTYFYFITISHKGIEHQYKGFLVLKR